MEDHLEFVCRVCTEDFRQRRSQCGSVFDRKQNDDPEILTPAEMLAICTQLLITNDDRLPKVICTPCTQRLTEAYRFCLQCRKADEKLRDQLKFSEQLQQMQVGEEQHLPDRIVDDLIGLPSAKPKNRNEILVDLMMRRDDELFDEIIEQDSFSTDESERSDGNSEQLGEEVSVEVVEVDRQDMIVKPTADSVETTNNCRISELSVAEVQIEEDLITVSEHDAISESDDSEIEEFDTVEKEKNIFTSRRSTSKSTMPPEEIIVKQEDHENYQVFHYSAIACCGCGNYFLSKGECEEHCRQLHQTNSSSIDENCCPLCHRKFRNANQVLRHTNEYARSRIFSCNFCTYVSHSNAAMNVHMKSTALHNKQMMDLDNVKEAFTKIPVEGYMCCDCYQMFPKKRQLENHYEEAHHPSRPKSEEEAKLEGKYWCTKCHLVLKSEYRYRLHNEGSKTKIVFCCKKEFCNYRTANIFYARFHLRSIDHESKSKKSTEKIGHRCCFRKCLEVFKSKDALLNHVDQVHQVKQLENELRRKKSIHVCHICSCNFISWQALKRHQRVKLNDHICEQCGAAYDSTFALHSHVAQVHPKDSRTKLLREFKCDQCPKTFVSAINLEHHKKRGHDNSSDSTCSICKKQFKSKENLWKHWRVHSSAESHECATCKKAGKRYRFRDLKTLNRHYKVSEMHNGGKKLKCTYDGCKNTYSHKADLQRHEMTVHQGLRPFVCKICDKGFIRDRELRLHERTHTGAKLYSCENCEAGFDVYRDYKKHCQDEHGIAVMIKYTSKSTK